jgi:hypothetical protein
VIFTDELQNIAALRAELWDAGYRPLAVLSHDHPDRQRAGKAPLGAQWRERALRDPPEAVTQAAVPHARNTGILSDGLRPIDIDVDDRNLAAQVRALSQDMLGDTPLRTRPNSGRCLLPYRAASGQPPKRVLSGRLGKIEVLGAGQQFVAYGVHPSGAPLQWFPVAPAEMAVQNLPAVTEDQITEFLRAAAPLIEAEAPDGEKKPNGQDGPNVPPGQSPPNVEDAFDVIAALAAIPNEEPADWEHWNAVGMATWAATGGSSLGFAAWRAWSAKHPAHDEAACQERWKHYFSSPPDRTGAGKLFALAVKAVPHWRRPSEMRQQAEPHDGWEQAPLECVELQPVEKEHLPPRQWAYGTFLLFGSAGVIGALDGGGKGALAVVMIIEMITGESLLGEHIWRTGPVAIVSYEDDPVEWQRRIAAACAHYRIDYATVITNIRFIHRPGGRVSFANTVNNMVTFPDGGETIRVLRDMGAALLVIDPFNHAHGLDDGNNNVLVAKVAGEMTRIAQESNTAVLVLHHLRKGASGQPDDLMGATALRATFRSARILIWMTPEEAKQRNLPDSWRFIRIASSKENYAPPPDQQRWFKLVGVLLNNGTARYPTGDNVAVATIWEPRPLFDGMDRNTLVAVFAALRRSIWSPRKQARNWAGKVLVDTGGRSEVEAGKIVATWLENEVMTTEKYYDKAHRHEVDRVVLNEGKVAEILASQGYYGEPGSRDTCA